jgi:hypothetical protein
MAFELEPLRSSRLSGLRVTFAGTGACIGMQWDLIVARVAGGHREGVAGKPDSRYLFALCQAAVIAWEPEGMILDFSDLDYRGGEDLDMILEIGRGAFGLQSLPLAVVVGPRCEEAVRSLFISSDMLELKEPYTWIYSDFGSARDFIEREIAKLREELRGIMRSASQRILPISPS